MTTQNTYTQARYDFAPFLSAATIREVARRPRGVEVVHIPPTQCPSPFADNIAPAQLLELYEHFMGPNTGDRGKETWLSWKRAWDLWNNHYIEGRVNTDWLSTQWNKRAKQRANLRSERPIFVNGLQATLTEPKVYGEHHGTYDQLPPPAPPGRKWIKAKNEKSSNITKVKRTRTVKKLTPVQVQKQRPVGGGFAFNERVPIQKWVEASEPKGSPVGFWADSDDYQLQPRPLEWYVDTEYEEVLVDEDYYVNVPMIIMHWELVDDLEYSRLRFTKSNQTAADNNEIAKIEDDLPPYATEQDGSSGGFYAMKDMEDFQIPPGEPWNDPLANCVWRPRRVGEKTLRIDMDEFAGDFDEFFDDNEFAVDGGVDCGRMPYPVLRWMYKYSRLEATNINAESSFIYKKKQRWDEVTGTIFNLPTTAIEHDEPEKDEGRLLVKETFRANTSKADFPSHNTDLFPLDIRRCKRVDRTGCEVLEDDSDETKINHSWDNPLRNYRSMGDDDPWYVTEEQETFRDVPPRRYPPLTPEYKSSTLLPVDDTHWVQNRVSDEMGNTRYFVTNLHGGTLIINGQEIRKGQVAGPLPEFAVIESPGGQISFWWGVRGRNWNQSSNPAAEHQWATLRQRPGWENVAIKAGEIWDLHILDRMVREDEGGPQDDDMQWERWKNPPSQVQDLENMTADEYREYYGTRFSEYDYMVTRDVGNEADTGPHREVPPSEVFESEEAELKWLSLTSRILEEANDQMGEENFSEGEMSIWPGADNLPTRSNAVTNDEINRKWNEMRIAQIKLQREFSNKIRKKRDADVASILECRKKCGMRKRKRAADDDEDGEEIQSIHQMKKAKQSSRNNIQNAQAMKAGNGKLQQVSQGTPSQKSQRGEDATGSNSDQSSISSHSETGSNIHKQDLQGKKGSKRWQERHEEKNHKHIYVPPPTPGREAYGVRISPTVAATQRNQPSHSGLVGKIATLDKVQGQKAVEVVSTLKKLPEPTGKLRKSQDENAQQNAAALAKEEEERKKKAQADKEATEKAAQKDAPQGNASAMQEDADLAIAEMLQFDEYQDLDPQMSKKSQKAQQKVFGLTPTAKAKFKQWDDIQAAGGDIDWRSIKARSDQSEFDLYMKWMYEKQTQHNDSAKRNRIRANLEIRAESEGICSKTYVEKHHGFATVKDYIDWAVQEEISNRRIPLTFEDVLRRGKQARAELDGIPLSEVASKRGYKDDEHMRKELSESLPTLPPPSQISGEAPRQLKDTWRRYNDIIREDIGDYEAEVQLVDKKRLKEPRHNPLKPGEHPRGKEL